MNTIFRSINTVLKERIHSDLTTDQFTTLQFIRNNERCTSTQIAQAFGIGKSAVTAQINRLYDKALIKRVRDDQDRRNIYLFVTEKGVELVEYTEEKLYTYLGEKLTHFEMDEIRFFIQSLEKLATLLED